MKPWRIAAAALLLLLFATNSYRAATQSITHDEALTWGMYLAGPSQRIFQHFDANHHFLGTLLEKLSTVLFGFSELSLRLPSLLAGAGYFLTAFRLALFLFADGPVFLLTVVLLSANPLVLDFLVAARGYGLALAFFLWAVFELLKYLAEGASAESLARQRRRLMAGSCGRSLAVASHLTLAFPVLPLALLFLWLVRRGSAASVPAAAGPAKARKKGRRKATPATAAVVRSPGGLAWLVLPAAGCALLFWLAAPLSRARTGHFFVGLGSVWASLENLARVSLGHNPGPANIPWDAGPLLAWR